MSTTIYVGQGQAKDCIVGDRNMNRYCVFNGLERPRRIGPNLTATILGFDLPVISGIAAGGAGSVTSGKWYAYRAVFASNTYTRPVAVADGSINFTRGNGSVVSSFHASSGSNTVTVAGSSDAGVTHILLYRSLGASTQAEAEAGPFFYATQAANAVGAVAINDGVADALVGLELETDNYYPNAYRYAVAAYGYIFAGGNIVLGTGVKATVTNGSPVVTLNSPIAYDGVLGWSFKCTNDTSGGVDNAGLYYANYVNSTTITLVNASNVATNYTGTSGSKDFTLYLPGFTLRWSKYGEPESWPLTNAITFEGDITGMAMLPNVSLLIVCTDQPATWVLDLTLVGTYSFKTQRRMISTELSATSHYSLCPVEGRLRGVDANVGCIFETDGVSVKNITDAVIPKIWEYLDDNVNNIKNWHCVYDMSQNLFGAFVTFGNAHRKIDFCIGQHTTSGNWFFNFEKDLLCTCNYTDPQTGANMVLGGTQGLSTGGGAVWGRIWTPDRYDEWVPDNSLRSGTILSATSTVLTVDNTSDDLHTANGGISGRWVLICDSLGEHSQLGYILSNTANTITIDSVLNSIDPYQFNPVPVAGWKFYVGLIEMRWGPKRFDFGDPDNDKKVMEICVVMSDYDSSDLPFIRTYRSLDLGYEMQNSLEAGKYRDATGNLVLFSRVKTHGEPSPRWGLSVLDRSYKPTALRSITIVFKRIGVGEGGGA